MMVMMAGFDLPVPVVRQYIAGGVALIVQLARLKGGQRRMTRVSEILRMKKGKYVVRDLFGFQQSGVEDGQAVGQFYATGRLPNCLDRLQANGIDLPTNLFTARTLDGPAEVDDFGYALT
jgi:pilus assembly protein CpaF